MLDSFRRARKQDYVDWRFYVGENTPAGDGESLAMRVSRTRWRAGIYLGGLAGTLVLRFATWRGPAAPVRLDPSWPGRLRRSERKYRNAARRFPHVDNVDPKHTRCVIYVHGTMSSALPALDAMQDVIGENVARYEHDTLVSIQDNADDLAKRLVDRRIEPRYLHFIGHSRGGLVARLAAAEVFQHARRWGPERIDVHTFGTPHRGTPLVGQMLADIVPLVRKAQLLNGIVADARELRWRDLGSMAWAYLLSGRPMPEGIGQMTPEGLFLRMVDSHARGITTIAYGADCDLEAAPSGTKVAFLQNLSGLFAGANDLVVGRDSATAVGEARPLKESCTHFDYFLNDEVRLALEQLP